MFLERSLNDPHPHHPTSLLPPPHPPPLPPLKILIIHNPTEIPKIRKNQFRVSRTLKLGGGGGLMVSFGNFARIASLCVGLHLLYIAWLPFHQDSLAKFEFPARTSNKTCFNREKPTITDKNGSSSACSTEFWEKRSNTSYQKASTSPSSSLTVNFYMSFCINRSQKTVKLIRSAHKSDFFL